MSAAKRIAFLLLVFIIAVTILGCSNSQTPEDKELVARVNDKGITRAQLDEVVDMLAQQEGIDLKADAHAEVKQQMVDYALNVLIQQELLQQYAKDQKITVDQEQIKTQMEQLRQLYGGEEQFAKLLKEQNLTEDTLKKQMEQSILVDNVFEKVTADVKVDQQEIESYYNDNRDSLTRAKVSHILVAADENANSEAKAKARAKAEEAIARLQKGEDFAKIAAELSDDPGSKDSGGVLPQPVYKDDPNFVPGFVAGVWNLKEGEFSSKPVESSYGFHVIKVDEVLDTLPELQDEIENTLLSTKRNDTFNNFFSKIYDAAKIEELIKTEPKEDAGVQGNEENQTGEQPTEEGTQK